MKIYIDVTAFYHHAWRSGIPRLLQRVSENLVSIPGVELVWFVIAGENIYEVPLRRAVRPPLLARSKERIRRLLKPHAYFHFPVVRFLLVRVWTRLQLIALAINARAGHCKQIRGFTDTDVVLFIDQTVSANHITRFQSVRNGALVLDVVSDLFFITYPHVLSPTNRVECKRNTAARLETVDGFICVSRATAKSVLVHLAEEDCQKPVTYCYLGSDLPAETQSQQTTKHLANNDKNSENPKILSINTLTPRKNYAFALSICTSLWAKGYEFDYVIAGAVAWESMREYEVLRSHPEFGKRLHFLKNADDADLLALYKESDIFLSTSFDEGFGISVMEAFHFDLKVACSDIAIFHELCGDFATYLPLNDVDTATNSVESLLRSPRPSKGELASSQRARPPGLRAWRECAVELYTQIEYFQSHEGRFPTTLTLDEGMNIRLEPPVKDA